ncbi:CinsV21_orph3 protein [Chelonus insularis]|nr:CinsV21_orph3 protein [Chelonus insularis]
MELCSRKEVAHRKSDDDTRFAGSENPHDSDSESEVESDNESDDSLEDVAVDKQKIKKNKSNTILSTELFQCRKYNLVYFVNENGHPSDRGSKKLKDLNKLPLIESPRVESIYSFKVNWKIYFACIIQESKGESMIRVKSHLGQCLVNLKVMLKEKNIETVSVAYSQYIENIPWDDVLSMIKSIFENGSIKVIICLGTIKHVPSDERNKIFAEAHSSPIGGHKGVSETYNRLKHNYYWEDSKGDVQRLIQQCLYCQLKKLTRVKNRQPMIITDTPGTVFEKIAIDIVGLLPVT